MVGMRWTVIDSPIGALSVASDGSGVSGVHFGAVDGPGPVDVDAVLPAAVDELRHYFDGTLTDFTVPLSVPRGSSFERAVWREMSLIPYGETRTYGAVAAAVGDPTAARAVGVACNRNPIPVIVPCHRIVGAGGKLVGFGGGLPRKRHLLELEAKVALARDWGA
jgi:methylated-DNA-[protein]-cysteine S-methyltransferase